MSEHIVRQTRQKDAIRDVLNGCDEFISAQELHRKLEDRGEHIGLATVYRQLNALAEAGRADTVLCLHCKIGRASCRERVCLYV